MVVSVKFCLIGGGLAAVRKEHKARKEVAPADVVGELGWFS